MNVKHIASLFIVLVGTCLSGKSAARKNFQLYQVKPDSLVLLDTARNRLIPLAVYRPANKKEIGQQPLVILNHGYQSNQPGSNKGYAYIGEKLASLGYWVVSIQHELPTDSLLPSAGIPQIVRRTNWERGIANILFVLYHYKKMQPQLDYRQVVLIGHSNGGDMCMLFGQRYPGLAGKIVSLDNRRVAFPRSRQLKILSIRSSDQLADEGVLPTPEEQKKYGIKIIQLRNTIHNDMGANASPAQRKEINNYISSFLKNR